MGNSQTTADEKIAWFTRVSRQTDKQGGQAQ